MKTKHLLAAIMLPALFAACTNDELESVSQNAETVNGRKLADNVTLSFSMTDNADTRLAYGNDGYTWQKNDTIGACLMDVITDKYYNPYDYTWSQRFDLTNYIQTNYKFTRDADGAWKTEAKLCEGNYFFCYPYNPNMGKRNAYTFSVEHQNMTNTTTAALQEAYAKNNKFIGFSKVERGNGQVESLGIEMFSVFGATGFTLKNTGTNTYKIEKIVLRGDKVIGTATVDPTTCDDLIQRNNQTIYTATSGEFNVANYVGDKADDQQYDRKNNDGYKANAAMRDVLNYVDGPSSVEVTLAAGNVVATQRSINVIAMVAEKSIANSNDAKLDIYTDKGMIRDIDLTQRYTANSGNTATTNVLTDVALDKIGSGNKVEITFDDTSIDVPSILDITSSADLASLIHWNAKVPTDITAKLKEDVVITKAMYNELASSQIKAAKIENSGNRTLWVTLAEDVPASALDRFDYTGNIMVYVKGTQTLAENHEAIEIAVDNKAVLNVNKDAKVKGVTNSGALNVNAKLTAINYAVNYSAVNIATGKKVNKLTNYGNVTNKGTIGELLDNNTNDGNYDKYPGAITNEGKIEAGVNNATITNNAGEVVLTVNNKVVYANKKSATVVADNSKGSIVITNLESDGNYKVATGKEGAIVQQLAAASTKEVDKRANTVWLTDALSVDPNKNKNGEMVDVDLSSITIYAKSSAARIDGNGKDQVLKLKGITVGAASTLVVNNVKLNIKDLKMEGNADKKKVATLTINSNAIIEGVNIPATSKDNVVKDYSNNL